MDNNYMLKILAACFKLDDDSKPLSIAFEMLATLVKQLAIDEISMRKGQQNFKIVVSDIDRGKLLEGRRS